MEKQPTRFHDVSTNLKHFSIVTYMVNPSTLSNHIHERFEPILINHNGKEMGLISVVPFVDTDFSFKGLPWFKWNFSQTNYRAYVKDKITGENVAWFFGTSLDSWTVNIPNRIWKLPWHGGKIEFSVEFDKTENKYRHYSMETESQWATAKLSLTDTGMPPTELNGFDDLQLGLEILTDPSKGYYYRRDGLLGTYSIYHKRMQVTQGTLLQGSFHLLDRLNLVKLDHLENIHSVLIQNEIEFEIFLPPKKAQLLS